MSKLNQKLTVVGNTISVYDPKTEKVKEAECTASNGILTIFKQLIANSTTDDPNIRYNKGNNEETSELWRMNEKVLSAMEDSDVLDGDGFFVQAYTVNFLPPIYPDKNLSKKENIQNMKDENYNLWVKTYEDFYKTKLTYDN